MIPITKSQADYLRKNVSDDCVITIGRYASKASKKTYQAYETKAVKKALKKFNSTVEKIIESYGEIK